MKRFAIIVLVALAPTAALAQSAGNEPPPAMDSNEAVIATSNVVQGTGVKVGEGTVLYPSVGLFTGIVSNVFFEETAGSTAGVLRLLVELGAGSLSSARLAIASSPEDQSGNTPGGGVAMTEATMNQDFQYQFDTYLNYDQYLSTNNNVQEQSGLGGGLLFRGIVYPKHAFAFSFLENFTRLLRPTNFESTDSTDRDINMLVLRLHYQPIQRNLGGFLFYQNKIDIFEEEQQHFLNRLQHTIGLRINYQRLPATRFFFQGSEGIYTTIYGGTKPNAYPLQLVVGTETALTVKTMLQARVGYTRGFYDSGADYNTVTGGVQFGWQYSPLGMLTALYRYDHEDSINGNFYRDHLIQAQIQQQFVPFVFFVKPELHLRRYEGLYVMGNSDVRDDTIFAVTTGLRYGFRNWLLGTIDYRFATDQTDFVYDVGGGMLDDPSYTRHELFVGVRAAY